MKRSSHRVVTDVATGCAQMNDRSGVWTLFPENVNVGHDVVPGGLFFPRGRFEVYVVRVSLHLGDLLRGDGQTKFLKQT